MTTNPPPTQLDRIERKLDELLTLRDIALQVFMPKIPAPFREKALGLMAKRTPS